MCCLTSRICTNEIEMIIEFVTESSLALSNVERDDFVVDKLNNVERLQVWLKQQSK